MEDDTPKELYDKNKMLYERLLVADLHIDLYKNIIVALLTRCGGDVTIDAKENKHNQENYDLIEHITLDAMSSSLRVRLRYNPKG